MAQIPVRMNTQGMSFPLLSQQSGRTIVNPSGDLTFVPGVTADGDIPEDRGIPGVMYCHNVMPTSYGWQAVGYEEQYGNVSGLTSGQYFTDIFMCNASTLVTSGEGEDAVTRPAAESIRGYLGVVTDGTNSTLYRVDLNGDWVPISNSPTFAKADNVSVAYINGYSYVCIARNGIYTIDAVTGDLVARDFNGLDETTVEGIFAVRGYVLVWSARRILWSSAVDVEDFEPSDISGAGGGGVQEAEGAIVYCTATNLGFMVFTDSNVVSAVYTANESFPFEFQKIPSAGGVYSSSLVSDTSAAGYYYSFTTNGIQRISHTGANTILTSISDFIGAGVFEDFNETTLRLEQTAVTGDMPRALSVVGNRYIIISYAGTAGTIVFTHAIIVDAIQNRMGKVKIDHTKAFEFRSTDIGTALDSRGTIAFLGPSGKVSTVKFDLSCQITDAVLILGKIQYAHQRMMQLQEIELENVCPSGNFSVRDYPSLDGKTFEPIVQGYENPDDSGKVLKRYYFNNVAKSHTLMFRGSFELLSILVWLNAHGMD